ncbi:MAG: chemotaxis response regulator protein-glutamate methylesterase [Nitrospiria bacterium]
MKTETLNDASLIRVLIVDDSIVVRKAVSDALKPDPDIEVVGTAFNGRIALEKIPELKPDILVLDIEMPHCDGFEVLRAIRGQFTKMRVIMFSSLTQRGAMQTVKALSLGANDYVLKPSTGTAQCSYSESVKKVASELTPKIKQFGRKSSFSNSASRSLLKPASNRNPVKLAPRHPSRFKPPEIVAIGISTGGPEALARVLPKLSPGFPVPIVIVQHMPPVFTKLLAQRLDRSANIKVMEGEEGMGLEPGAAYFAPGGYHMIVRKTQGRVVLSINQAPPENSCRPAADVLFRSVAEVYGGHVLGVIMTGMGRDGLEGSRLMRQKGASILAQDEASSVVWGMPSSVVEEGLADQVLPLNELAGSIERCVARGNLLAASMK